MPTSTLTVAADALVYESKPSANYGGLSVLSVRDSAPTRLLSLVHFNQPFPSGVTVISATLRLYQKGAATGGTRIVTAQRAGASWPESQVTWTNRPGVTGVTATRSLGDSATDGREWSFDVQAIMQDVSNGGLWFGFWITSNLATLMQFYAKEGGGAYAPSLEVVWSDAPSAPTDLSPAAGRAVSIARPTLTFDFSDAAGDTTLAGFQVQVATDLAFTSLLVDSGIVASDSPTWALTVDAAVATTYYWRVKVKDGAGLWSAYSTPTTFIRTAQPVVTITNPPAPASNIVYESTPTFSWTVSTTQRAFQLFVTDPADTSEVLWTSNKITSATTSSAIGAADSLVLSPGGSYRLVVRVWDTVARESTPGDPAYVDTERAFSFGTSGTGVSALTATVVPGSPFVTLGFTRATAPDSFCFTANGEMYAAEVDPADIFVSGTSYSYVVRLSQPRTLNTFGVGAVSGGSTSTIVTTTATTEPTGLWLVSLDAGGPDVSLAGAPNPVGVEASEDTAVLKPVGAKNAVLISQSVRGPDGSVSADLNPADLADWESLVARRGVTLGLMVVDTAKKVQIYDVVRNHAQEFTGTIPVEFRFIEIR